MVSIALTPGCPAGIGPELFPKALELAHVGNDTHFVWCGSAAQLVLHAQGNGIANERQENVVILNFPGRTVSLTCVVDDRDDLALRVKPGVVNSDALLAQVAALDLAIGLAQEKKVHAIVTGPIRKAALPKLNGQSFDGQTEYLHHFLASDSAAPLMCFAGADFLLGLATIHVPLKDVSSRLSREMIEAKLRRLNEAAQSFFELSETPRLTVLGLNPHAGEGGLIGDEEKLVLTPAIHKLVAEGLKIDGPIAADGFFGHLALNGVLNLPHAVLAMYHDQGLAPYKLLCRGIATNMTIGLKITRTSPAHGTADDLAGTYKGNAASTARAIEIAEKISSNIS